jgi:predicted lipid-binding transport protein (Tim44 family)
MDIIVFAILAAFLFFRLWSVLGTRTGNEKQVDLLGESEKKEDNIIVLSKRTEAPKESSFAYSSAIRGQIHQVQDQDHNFDPEVFLKASKSAFTAVIMAYAQANHQKLKKLLNTHVYEQFAAAIEDREQNNLRQETEIENVEAEYVSLDIFDGIIQICVRFRSDQMIATINEAGESFDNPSRLKTPMVDLWTFERPIHAKDPTWRLVRTQVED